MLFKCTHHLQHTIYVLNNNTQLTTIVVLIGGNEAINLGELVSIMTLAAI